MERPRWGAGEERERLTRSICSVPAGNSPYLRAKHHQLVEKDHKAAILWFWKAINAGDRVDNALKEMAVEMKQTDRAEEAIEAIKSFRHLCSKQAQESLDNLLIDIYKKCGQLDEQIHLYKQKLRDISLGQALGKTTNTAQSIDKNFQVSIKQETACILGNLGWAYMQQNKYDAAEVVYRKVLQVKPDASMACHLGHCLIKKGRFDDAFRVLDDVINFRFAELVLDESRQIVNRAEELMMEMEEARREEDGVCVEVEIKERLELVMSE